MFNKLKATLFCVALMLSLIAAPRVYSENPDRFSVTTASDDTAKIDYRGAVVGFLKTVEVFTTSDTVTRSESGKLFLVNATSGQVVLTLPTAAEGIVYQFKALNAGDGESKGRIVLDPASGDIFVGCINSAAINTFSLGDRLASPIVNVTGDSVTLTAASGNRWVCSDITGTWIDFN